MATLVTRGDELEYTILPYSLEAPIQQELTAHPSDKVLGYITYDEENGKHNFVYTESGGLIEANNHWSLNIIKQFPYCEENCSWIVYSCSPEKTKLKFGKILSKYHQTLHIDSWDTWAVEGKESKVAVITSWERY